MSKTQFTPEPWRVDSSSNDQGQRSIVIRDGLNQQIASINPYRIMWRDGDAALIAAAPELYAIVDELLARVAWKNINPATLEKAKKLLAKARGEV